jgi:hypothetical protein
LLSLHSLLFISNFAELAAESGFQCVLVCALFFINPVGYDDWCGTLAMLLLMVVLVVNRGSSAERFLIKPELTIEDDCCCFGWPTLFVDVAARSDFSLIAVWDSLGIRMELVAVSGGIFLDTKLPLALLSTCFRWLSRLLDVDDNRTSLPSILIFIMRLPGAALANLILASEITEPLLVLLFDAELVATVAAHLSTSSSVS